MPKQLLEVRNLKKYFPVKSGFLKKTTSFVKAVDNISFKIDKGETLGLVGESGCGKTTVGRSILRLIEPTSGEVFFNDESILIKNKQAMRSLRRDMQIIFQDPYSSLNPRMTVSEIVGEALVAHKLYKKGKEVKDKVAEIVEICGLARYHMNRYPHQFSGGQRQRIGIARALALNPTFIVADEPVSALDVSIQSQILNLMMDLQESMGLGYLFISHDLSVVKHISHKIGVMYLGSLVELADKNELYNNPIHPYTRALLSVIPIPDPTIKKKSIQISGEIPSNVNVPKGCKFHTRCPMAKEICRTKTPEFKDIGNNHFVACHFASQNQCPWQQMNDEENNKPV